ncbi:branched-chain amino acid transport system II carrier protein [Dolosigranulum pigrum]|jgi:branched-chain amino acid transport system II carrier protein
MEQKLSTKHYITIGVMLFGMFFGAGNLIFPIFMGQNAGVNFSQATLGFIITGVIVPFLGIVALGVSRKESVFEMASKVHPIFGYIFTVALYMTIGPLFAIPRLATVPFEISMTPFVPDSAETLGLAIFSILFFAVSLFMSLNPTKVLTYVGKWLTPAFLVVLAILFLTAIFNPMGEATSTMAVDKYIEQPFFTGFLEGYNTMDALASLAFGVVVINTIKQLGVSEPKAMAISLTKSGVISLLLMAVIYWAMAFVGASSVSTLGMFENGGLALGAVNRHYFGGAGNILLALMVILACVKTSVGLTVAISESFVEMFPNSFSYKTWVILVSLLAGGLANIGLTNVIAFAVPVLMFLYPLAITLIFVALLSRLFNDSPIVYIGTILFVLPISLLDGIRAALGTVASLENYTATLQPFFNASDRVVPFMAYGMGWVVPAVIGFVLSYVLYMTMSPRLKRVDRHHSTVE